MCVFLFVYMQQFLFLIQTSKRDCKKTADKIKIFLSKILTCRKTNFSCNVERGKI